MFLNFVYGLILFACSPILVYRTFKHGKYRRGWREKLWGDVNVPVATGPRFWFHAVSVGEVNLLGGMIASLREQIPHADIVVSTTTATGFELARRRFPQDRVFYSPLDFTWSVRRVIHRVRPDCIVLAELEVWPNWIREARRKSIPIAVVNGRLSLNSFRGYQRIDYLVRSTFGRLTLVAAQSELYAERFRAMGVPSSAVHVTGSTKFDDAPLTRNSATIDEYRQLIGAEKVLVLWIAGSTQAGEEAVAMKVYRDLQVEFPQLRLICVPRHAERFDTVAHEIVQMGFACRRRSQLNDPKQEWDSETILLIDSIGELRAWWGLADIAFVGGSLGSRGGQNMLEPAGYGAAVCFGPNTQNFRDIVSELLQKQAACVVNDQESLKAFVRRAIEHPVWARQQGENAQQVIQSHQGATRKTIQLLLQSLPLSLTNPNTHGNE